MVPYLYSLNGSILILSQWFHTYTLSMVPYLYSLNGSILILSQWFPPLLCQLFHTSSMNDSIHLPYRCFHTSLNGFTFPRNRSIPILYKWFYFSTLSMVLCLYPLDGSQFVLLTVPYQIRTLTVVLTSSM